MGKNLTCLVQIIFFNTCNSWSVEFTEAQPMDSEGRLYFFRIKGLIKKVTIGITDL
jgi:hypothetical protein